MCAVSSTTLICNSPRATSSPNSSRFLFRDLGIVPNALMIIGTISTGLSHSLLSSIRMSWYLSLLSCSFCSALESQDNATSMSDTLLIVLSTKVKSDGCAGITLSWYYSPRTTLHSHFQSLAVDDVHTTYYCKAFGICCTDSSAQL